MQRSNGRLGYFTLIGLLLVGLTGIGSNRSVVSAAPAARSAAMHASAWKHGQVGEVRYIKHGLTVTPPRKKHVKGKIHMPLFNQYGVRTGVQEKASISFADGTLIHLNQRTSVELASPSLTKVKQGEIQEVLTPGTKHGVQVGAALGAATGTIFDVKIVKKLLTFIVLEGALHVKNKKGSVVVKTNQETTVKPQQKPTTPIHVDAAALTTWSTVLPPANVAEQNVALDANGGRVTDYSSQSSDSRWAARNLVDGHLDSGWATAAGHVSNEWAKIGFAQNESHMIGAVVLDPGATHGHPAANDLKDFQIRVSTTGLEDANFSTVFTGTTTQQHVLQRFVLPKPVAARYVELVAVNNYGGAGAIDVAEFEVVAFGQPITLPIPRLTDSPCTAATQDGCIQALLDLINATRAENHLGPLILNLTQTRGTNSCVGSYGHSKAMAETHTVWNTHEGYDKASFPRDICLHSQAPGENIGLEATGGELQDLKTVHQDMMFPPHDAGACAGTGNSACNIVAPDFNQVGIGLYTANGGTYVTEDFLP